MNISKKEILYYLDNFLLFIVGAFLLLYPVVFSVLFTDAFAVTKQTLLLVTVLLSFLLLSIRMVVLGKVQLRSTPFDLPVLLFALVTLLTAIFAINRFDALINYVPLLLSVLLFYTVVNVVKKGHSVTLMAGAMVVGAAISGIISLLSFAGLYIFPYPATQIQSFTTFGSLLDQAIYTAIVLPLAGYFIWPYINRIVNKKKSGSNISFSDATFFENITTGVFGVAGLFLIISLGVTVFMLVTTARPLILPLETGFQTGFASISQDAGRVFKSFLLGSGYGTYVTDFTRYKQAQYNLDSNLWAFTFFRSSTYMLELLAVAGIAGILSFLFIVYRFIRQKTMFLPLLITLIGMLILPFSTTLLTVFFIMLGLFCAVQALNHPSKYEDLEFYFVAMKKGLIAAVPESEAGHSRNLASDGHARLLPFIAALLVAVLLGLLTFMSGKYIISDYYLQKSLEAAAQNNGLATYNFQRDAIAMFPYRDSNHRIFSQTNLALANSLAVSSQGQQLDEQTQQTILQLIQQSINAGRNAVTISPQTAANWNNLSNVYRALIGFGQNADQFAVITNQEAIRLDPTNPQQYINLGGIFYQLGLYPQAINQFQIAIQLKPDLANAYYNLGKALESSGDLQGALSQYLAVRNLVQTDQASLVIINKEITTLQDKIGQAGGADSDVTGQAENQPPIGVNESENQLPERDPEVEIEGPSPSPASSPSPSPAASPAVSPTATQ
jgi:tetratricopeptide (TPR) repeat protein